MSIDATLEIGNQVFSSFNSKALASLLGVLDLYCDRATFSAEERDNWQGEIKWFDGVRSGMKEPLCLLREAYYGFWEYAEGDYDQYVIDYQNADSHFEPLLSLEGFLDRCREYDKCWMEAHKMLDVVNDFIQALEKTEAKETWWYDAYALADYKELSSLLTNLPKEVEKVRFYIS